MIDCLRKRWYENWLKNGWMTADKKPVENKDLWERLLAFLPDYEFRFYLVKGHIGAEAHEATVQKAYEHFVRHNGDGFSFEEFVSIAERNGRADGLAVLGAKEARGSV